MGGAHSLRRSARLCPVRRLAEAGGQLLAEDCLLRRRGGGTSRSALFRRASLLGGRRWPHQLTFSSPFIQTSCLGCEGMSSLAGDEARTARGAAIAISVTRPVFQESASESWDAPAPRRRHDASNTLSQGLLFGCCCVRVRSTSRISGVYFSRLLGAIVPDLTEADCAHWMLRSG